MLVYVGLVLLGVVLGAVGTVIGAGGGFLLVPLLLLFYPGERPEVVTSISLAVVALNALSGSISYARLKRIDYRAGVIFAAATVPGAILGAVTTTVLPRRVFDLILGAMFCGVAALLWRRPAATAPRHESGGGNPTEPAGTPASAGRIAVNWRLGVLVSLVVGYVSSVLGIGGGIIHVPALVQLLGFPIHVATATSHFVLAIMAGTATLTHVFTGAFHHGVRRTIALGIGVLVGAPLGAAVSGRVHGVWIIRGLAVALAFAGVRVLLLALWPAGQ